MLENTTATFSVAGERPRLALPVAAQWPHRSPAPTRPDYTTSDADRGRQRRRLQCHRLQRRGRGVEPASAVLTVLALVPPTVTEHPVNTSVAAGHGGDSLRDLRGNATIHVQMTRWSGAAWLPCSLRAGCSTTRRLHRRRPSCSSPTTARMFRFEVVSGPGQAYGTTTNAGDGDGDGAACHHRHHARQPRDERRHG